MSIEVIDQCAAFLRAVPNIGTVIGSDAKWDRFIFQETISTKMEGTQKVAVVLIQQGSWTAPNRHNTANFPRLITEYWADPPRDAASRVTNSVKPKRDIKKAHEFIDPFLHNVSGHEAWWPSFGAFNAVRVINSTRQGELEFFEVPEGNGLMRATVSYALIVA